MNEKEINSNLYLVDSNVWAPSIMEYNTALWGEPDTKYE